jgi:hypothetical protein
LTRLEKLARDKHSSVLPKFVNYGRKKFYNIGPRPEEFWICNCVTYPVLEGMPNNILISQRPVETLHCVLVQMLQNFLAVVRAMEE